MEKKKQIKKDKPLNSKGLSPVIPVYETLALTRNQKFINHVPVIPTSDVIDAKEFADENQK